MIAKHPHYEAGVQLEGFLNDKYQSFSKSPHKSKRIGLHPDRIPLRDIPPQLDMFDEYMDADMGCELGMCGV